MTRHPLKKVQHTNRRCGMTTITHPDKVIQQPIDIQIGVDGKSGKHIVIHFICGPVTGFSINTHTRSSVGCIPPYIVGNIVRQDERKTTPCIFAVIGVEIDPAVEPFTPLSESSRIQAILRICRIVNLCFKTLVDRTKVDHHVRREAIRRCRFKIGLIGNTFQTQTGELLAQSIGYEVDHPSMFLRIGTETTTGFTAAPYRTIGRPEGEDIDFRMHPQIASHGVDQVLHSFGVRRADHIALFSPPYSLLIHTEPLGMRFIQFSIIHRGIQEVLIAMPSDFEEQTATRHLRQKKAPHFIPHHTPSALIIDRHNQCIVSCLGHPLHQLTEIPFIMRDSLFHIDLAAGHGRNHNNPLGTCIYYPVDSRDHFRSPCIKIVIRREVATSQTLQQIVNGTEHSAGRTAAQQQIAIAGNDRVTVGRKRPAGTS